MTCPFCASTRVIGTGDTQTGADCQRFITPDDPRDAVFARLRAGLSLIERVSEARIREGRDSPLPGGDVDG